MGQSKRVKSPKRSKVVKEDTSDSYVLRGDSEYDNLTGVVDDEIYQLTDLMPMFTEGNPAQWLDQHVVYPAEAVGSGVEGRVAVQCVIERDGSLSNVKVIKSLGPLFDKEAVRVVESMPKWRPGKNRGRGEARCYYTLPVKFKKP